MNTKEILKDIGARTNGEIYLGVVGPSRSGKSTFIKKFMELLVVPNMSNEYEKGRTIDELPQSGEGKQIMTTEPKFVPNNACLIKTSEELKVKVRLVDCVGYVIESAKGYKDEEKERMIKTPWFEDPIPFKEAARIGTQKVIQDHSSIGVLVTSDGSILDFSRLEYQEKEEEVVNELKTIGKPFIVILNCLNPLDEKTILLAEELSKKYEVPCKPLALEKVNEEEILGILKDALYEFPIANINVSLPSWVASLEESHYLKKSLNSSIEEAMQKARKIKDVDNIGKVLSENENIEEYKLANVDTSNGEIEVQIEVKDELYEKVLLEVCGKKIEDKCELLKLLIELSNAKKSYEGIKEALMMAKMSGYGYQTPSFDSIEVSKPELTKIGNRYGVKINAKAPTYHIIKVDCDSSFEPLVGSKEQGEFLLDTLNQEYDKGVEFLLESQLFGKKLKDVITSSFDTKLNMLPKQTQFKVQQLVKTLANKGKSNLIAIVF